MIRALLNWICRGCDYDRGYEDGYEDARTDFERVVDAHQRLMAELEKH